MRNQILAFALLSSGSILPSTAAFGQADAAPATPARDDIEENVPEIIVTAQKREERLQDVPIAITVVSGDALNAAGAKNLTELQGLTPGTYFSGNSSYGGSPISIRGTAGANSIMLDDPVAIYVNGVYQPSGVFSTTALLDVASIQVVRGPQGTLQGRNATAGAILIDSANPGADFDGFIRTSYADPAEFRIEGAAGGPISDTLGVRLAASYYDEKGWARNTFNNESLGGGHGFSARGTLVWRPVDSVSARLVVGHILTYAEPALARYAATTFNPLPTGPLVLAATPTTPLSPAQLNALANDQYALNRPMFNRITDDSASLNLTFGLGGVDLVSVTGYDDVNITGASDSDGFARTDREGFNTGAQPSKYFSQELRLQSSGNGRLTWILGAYYSSAVQDMLFLINNLQLSVPDRRTTRFEPHQTSRSYAGFADATFAITPTLSIIGGIRYTRETKKFRFDRLIYNYDTGVPLAPLFQYAPPQAAFTNTSYRVKATYKPTDDLLLYAGYSTGFKSGGFNAFGTDPAFAPEQLKSAEVGFKADLLERRATVSLSAYSNLYTDLQVRVGVASGGVAISNAANSKIEGFELEAALQPTPDLSFVGNLAYTHARFTKFPGARNLLDQPFDAKGNQLPRTPEWQYYLQGRYTPALSDTLTGLLEASFRWHDRVFYYFSDQTSPTTQSRPAGEIGLRIGFTHEPSKISVTAFATNLNNNRTVNGGGATFAYPNVSFNKPRVIGLQVEKKF